MRIMLENVRLAFPNLFKAATVNGEGEPAFSASFIMPPDHKAVKALNDAINVVAKEKWGAKADAYLKAMRAQDKTCLHDGDTKSNYDGYPGNLFVSARSKVRPTVIDRDRTPLTPEDGKPYSGCYVNASIELWVQDNNYGKRVNAQVRGVQFFADGDHFAGGGTAADSEEFADMGAAEVNDPTA